MNANDQESKMNPIEAAVIPLKGEAIQRAEQVARAKVAWMTKRLEESGFDLRIAAPYPNGMMARAQYAQASSLHSLFSSITKRRQAGYMRNEPMLVDIVPAKVERFVEESRENASKEYDAFITKLTEKIGKCVKATLTGNHVWDYSLLIVVKADGTVEKWKTQMIVNVSKLGKLFNQFPTRKIK